MDYVDFELLVTPEYRIRADSEQGAVDGQMALDLDEIELALQLLEQERTNATLLKGLGGKLYGGLFPPAVHTHLRATAAAAEAGGCGLRLRLIIEAPELAALPWELLYDGQTNTFLANSTQTALSRYIRVPQTRRAMGEASPPLKILVVISSPHDYQPLGLDADEALLRDALAGHLAAGRIEMDVIKQATVREINQALRRKPYNVFHYLGHGLFREDGGYIVLEDEEEGARFVDEEAFSNLFLGNRSLGLVVLNACQGATTSPHRALTGIAPRLVARGIPAVIAMQYRIDLDTARLFSDEFYRTLALGWPVDTAMQTTRNAISLEVGLDRHDFAIPVLFMLARDGAILSGL